METNNIYQLKDAYTKHILFQVIIWKKYLCTN